mmetsp:Transcript_5340/g.12869  ORF Transcript_5340/g.12869 Transcript_5340/m.12869 type:complete len:238 (+) Transcript_5340:2547-3260(+)
MSPETPHTPQSSSALMVAVLGHLYSIARPPNAVPFDTVLHTLLFTLTSRLPVWATKKVLPTVPCWMTVSPPANSKNSITSTICPISASFNKALALSFLRAVLISSLAASSFVFWALCEPRCFHSPSVVAFDSVSPSLSVYFAATVVFFLSILAVLLRGAGFRMPSVTFFLSSGFVCSLAMCRFTTMSTASNPPGSFFILASSTSLSSGEYASAVATSEKLDSSLVPQSFSCRPAFIA